MHAIQSPFTGLIVGGLSVVFITMIARLAKEAAGSSFKMRVIYTTQYIFNALVFVLTVKALASPHSPIGAYVAVSSQAILGILFFTLIPVFSIATMFTAFLSSTLSALQKLFVLWIVFGSTFFEALDDFVISTAQKFEIINTQTWFSSSEWIALFFVMLYALGGLVTGFVAVRTPILLKSREPELNEIISKFNSEHITTPEKNSAQPRFLIVMTIFIALAILIQYVFVSAESAIWQLIRTVSILFVWLYLLRPIFHWIVKRSMAKSKSNIDGFQNLISIELPKLMSYVPFAYRHSRKMSGFWLTNFFVLYLKYGLNEQD